MLICQNLALLFGVTSALACPGSHSDVDVGATLAFDGLPQTVSCATDDADASSAGFQLEVTVLLADEDGSGFTTVHVTSSREGIADGESTFVDGRATVIVEVVPGTENTLTATATNSDGEAITASESVLVLCDPDEPPPPACVFTSPEDGATLTKSPTAVTVTCSGGDPHADDEQLLLASGNVVVTASPSGAGPPQSVEIDLAGGTGTGDLALPLDDAATLDLRLVDAASVFDAPVIDAIDVVIDVS